MELHTRVSLPKWPFLLGDMVLVALAVFLVLWQGRPLDASIAAIATLLGILGCIVGIAPYVVDYHESSRRELDAERAVLRDLSARLSAVGRDLDVAAESVRTAAEETARAARLGDSLPSRMQSAVVDLERRVANVNTENSERFAMVGEQLQRAVQQFATSEALLLRSTQTGENLHQEIAALNMALARAEFDRRNTSAVSQEPAAPSNTPADDLRPWIAGQLDEMRAQLAAIEAACASAATPARDTEALVQTIEQVLSSRFHALEARLTSQARESRSPASEPTNELQPPEPSQPQAATEVNVSPESAAPSRRKRLPFAGMLAGSLLQPQTPAVERIIAAGRRTPEERPTSNEEPLTEPPISRSPKEADLPTDTAVPQDSLKSTHGFEESLGLDLGEIAPRAKPTRFKPIEGAAVIVVRAYIGIGNKLYIRGDGPGLSRERGTPMEFLEIGKWGWACQTPGEEIRCKVYRNDEEPAAGDEAIIGPGQCLEITPTFPSGP
jgi:hypothetical protein